MSDDTQLNGTEPIAPEMAAPVPVGPKTSSGDFLSTTAGKAVLIGAAIVLLLVVAGVVGWFVLGPSSLGGSAGAPGTPTVVVSNPGTPTAPSAPASSTVTTPVADITSRDVFTPRNPFTVIKPATISTSTTGATHNNPDDVILTDIVTVDGVRKAVIEYGGHTYTLGANELIPGTSDWKVLAVHANDAVLLFGDVTVTLTPGQGTSK